MCGGIMLSQTITSDDGNRWSSIKPSLLYNSGRIISYTVLGGIVGAIGSVFNVSIYTKAGIMIFAGLFMLIMGLNMYGFNILRKLHIKLPIPSCASRNRSKAPFVIGILNGFMPCGPLQTMQLYALGTGSALKGSFSMFIFALGTVPLMMLFGAAAGFLSRDLSKKILKFSGLLIVVLGLVMSNRGLALAGVNINPLSYIKTAGSSSNSKTPVAKAVLQDGVQVVRMTATGWGYEPNAIVVQKGVPVRWIIDGKQITSCNNEIVVPSLDVKKKLKSGENIIELPALEKDTNFSCWMGMIRGVIKVVTA
jgi:sulfite exporter TauE/SafE